MRKVLALTAMLTLSAPALADTYQVVAGFSDPTTYNPDDQAPTYTVKYRVAGGAETVLPASSTTGRTFSVTANPGDAIEVTGYTCNGALCGPDSPWIAAAAGYQPTTPLAPGGWTITVTRTGP